MEIKPLNPRKALNKAYLKVKAKREEIEGFKSNLLQLLNRINDSESEEFHKNLVIDFLKKTYYDPHHFINTKGRTDLVIHNGEKPSNTVGVIVETKKPTNKSEMLTKSKINVKAFHELILYYLRERITLGNIEIKYVVATNIYEWYIFDATLFDRLFAQNKDFVKKFTDFETQRLTDSKTNFFYKDVAEPFIAALKNEIEYTYFDIREFEKALRNTDKKDDNKLIALFKLLSPEHLLKLPFANDSNSLDKKFYSELLHIIGLTETKEGSKKLIERNREGERNRGSLLENAIIQLDTLDKITRLENPSKYGANMQERLFNVALELSITWINRILFLKLLEAQLINYHKGDESYQFLSIAKIKDYDDLNSLFFQVLARKQNERNDDVKNAFAKVPYLNSSLFEPTDIEQANIFISNLRNDRSIPIYQQTVLKDTAGKKRIGNINPLQYLFEFLAAYDFSSEGKEEIQEENKTLINASVLGLIFEKINGYKDGSFFTPGFITMYMCRETIRKAVVQKFNENKGWDCADIDSLYNKIEDRVEANKIINNLKICDPAVGSGHFLVSALNEIIAIKHDLKILLDREGKRLKEYHFEVVNDELIVTDEDGELFEYNPTSKESQRIQETLFHEKQAIIENCLFGVDINPNSVKICRLRLWIELLKNAYYKSETELETLPNIDINIKCGNSLISRYPLDANLRSALKTAKISIESYRSAISTYRNTSDKNTKREMEKLILKIKQDFTSEIRNNDPIKTRLDKLANELYNRFTGNFLFEPEQPYGKKEKELEKKRKKEQEKLEKEIKDLTQKIDEIKSNTIYENSFEWRFEFPEVLDDNGDFVGFDVVIGNPPYGVKFSEREKQYFDLTFNATDDIYTLFIELGLKIVRLESNICLINPITWLTGEKYKKTRSLFITKSSLTKAINLPYNIFVDAFVDTGIYFFQRKDNDESLVFEFNPKQKIQDGDLRKISFKVLEKRNWIQRSDLRINVNESDNLIFSKLDSIPTRLYGFTETTRGILANKVDYCYEFSSGLKRVFIGNLNRYYIDNSFSFIEYGDNLKEKPRTYDFFIGEKILVRRIISRQFRIMATYCNEEFVCKKDIYIIKINSDIISYKYLLAIINSKLISYYKTKNSGSAKKDDFTQITLNDIRQLPIPQIDRPHQEPFIQLVDEILFAKKNEQNTSGFESQVDQLVYKLYDLTEEEIAIVENGVKSC